MSFASVPLGSGYTAKLLHKEMNEPCFDTPPRKYGFGCQTGGGALNASMFASVPCGSGYSSRLKLQQLRDEFMQFGGADGEEGNGGLGEGDNANQGEGDNANQVEGDNANQGEGENSDKENEKNVGQLAVVPLQEGMSSEAIIAIVVGSIFALFIIAALIYFFIMG